MSPVVLTRFPIRSGFSALPSTVISHLMHTSQHFLNPISTTSVHSTTFIPISHSTASRTLPVLSSAVASITPTRFSVKNVSQLQRLQTMLARVVTCQRGRISISKTLQELHWLSIKWRLDYKVATLTYKFLESGEPTYLRSRITSKIFRHTLRSSADDRQLEPCSSCTKIGSRAFRCAAPAICNYLPYDIRTAPSVSIFRSRLKMHYFKLAL